MRKCKLPWIFSEQILIKLENDVDEYLYLPCVVTKLIKPNGKRVLEAYFNATVYMTFLVCFAIVKYEKDMVSLCETTYVYIDAFLLLQNPFTSVRTFKLIKTILFFYMFCKVYLH